MKFEFRGKEMRASGRFVRAVERHLRLPKELRKRVLSDLQTTICARLEAGESEEQILAALGTPEQVAEEFNEQLGEFSWKKNPWRFAFLILAVLSALWLVFWGAGQAFFWSLTNRANASVGIIGGADGPTQIFVTSTFTPWRGVIVALALLAVGIVGFICLKRGKWGKKAWIALGVIAVVTLILFILAQTVGAKNDLVGLAILFDEEDRIVDLQDISVVMNDQIPAVSFICEGKQYTIIYDGDFNDVASNTFDATYEEDGRTWYSMLMFHEEGYSGMVRDVTEPSPDMFQFSYVITFEEAKLEEVRQGMLEEVGEE